MKKNLSLVSGLLLILGLVFLVNYPVMAETTTDVTSSEMSDTTDVEQVDVGIGFVDRVPDETTDTSDALSSTESSGTNQKIPSYNDNNQGQGNGSPNSRPMSNVKGSNIFPQTGEKQQKTFVILGIILLLIVMILTYYKNKNKNKGV